LLKVKDIESNVLPLLCSPALRCPAGLRNESGNTELPYSLSLFLCVCVCVCAGLLCQQADSHCDVFSSHPHLLEVLQKSGSPLQRYSQGQTFLELCGCVIF